MIGLFVAIFFISIIIIIAASNKKGPELMDQKVEKIQSFEVGLPIQKCFQKILNYATSSKYNVEALDEVNYKIVLGEDVTLTTNGFFFPIYLTANEDKTKVEVGIKSKSVQIGPLVGKTHQTFINNLKVALLSE